MSSQLFDVAKQNATQASQLDRAGQHKAAVPYYIKAAEILQKLINFTDSAQMKQVYYDRALEYIYRVKEIQGAKGSPSGAAPSAKDTKDKDEDEIETAASEMIMREKPNVKWEDVANLESAKSALREAVILPMTRPDLFQGARKPWKGVLLHGPPGTGKTLLAKAVANECDATFFVVSAAAIVSKWLGESEKTVKELYEMSRKESPSIVFIDEVDALAGARGGSGESDAMRRVKNQLLQSIEGVTGKGELVVTIGATNTPWDIDAAMRRRFERRIYVPLPAVEARKAVFQIHTKGVDLAEDIDFDELASWTNGYSGADISLLCREALMRPIREMDAEGLLTNADIKPRNPGREDFLTAIETIKPSVAPSELGRFNEWSDQFGS